MTSAALAAGCALLAFSPSASLLFLIAYQKAQLIIVITTSAFFFLLSTLFTSLLWLPLPSSFQSNNNGVVLIVLGVVFQFLFRCAFVHVYHRVEHVIEISIKKHERLERREEEEERRRREQQQQQQEEERLRNTAATAIINGNNESGRNGHGNLHHRNVSNTSADNNTPTSLTRQTPTHPSSSSSPPPPTTATTTTTAISETARLRLELNDVSCGIAAGTGYGGMHAILLYGTLLASESGNVGTLYQPSCGSFMPGLVHSAITAFFFGVLDVVWMLLAFYGVRRAKYAPVAEQRESSESAIRTYPCECLSFWNRLYPNTKRGGMMALLTALASHFGAGSATLFNSREDGCVVSLSVLGGVVIATMVLFWLGISNHYLPENQRRRLLQNRLGGAMGRVNGSASIVNEEEGTPMNSHHVD